jgi:hypothetical protein
VTENQQRRTRKRRPNGYVVWEGESALDVSRRIALICTLHSTNRKTGNMAQTWIMDRNVHPVQARVEGSDTGYCPHSCGLYKYCYVQHWNAPAAIWNAYKAGRYPKQLPPRSNRPVRVGALGEPTAVPHDVWEWLLSRFSGHVGYTHRWREVDPRVWARTLHASVESVEQQATAQRNGWCTFRVLDRDSRRPLVGETQCYADPHGVDPDHLRVPRTCRSCLCCCGATGRNICITPHGSRAQRLRKEVLGASSGA